jgi:glycosyltransferase 2 family protein
LKRILRVSAIVLLTAIFLALFLWKSNLRDVWRILLTTNMAWFATGFIINGSALIFRTIRWRILLHESGPPTFYPTFFANTMGYMLSTVLPIRAGDVARPALLARRTHVRFSEALGTVLTERVLDLLAILLLFVFFCIFRWRDFDSAVVHGGAGIAGAMLAVLALLIVAFRFFRSAVRRAHQALGRVLPQRFHDPWMRFFDAFATTLDITKRPLAFAGIMLSTVIIWFCLTSQFWFVLMAAHRPLPFDSSFFLTAATTVGIAIPTPGGVGGFHKACQYVLTTFYQFDIDSSVAVAVLFHIVGTLPVVVVGAILFLHEGLNWRELSQETHIEET